MSSFLGQTKSCKTLKHGKAFKVYTFIHCFVYTKWRQCNYSHGGNGGGEINIFIHTKSKQTKNFPVDAK